ncbi:MAG TPA: lipocalin-like domain-containing protein [Caldilineaceae bacterium]|nr:lipocalin-like domain-containing protein [Caldilineaceae bacterium]
MTIYSLPSQRLRAPFRSLILLGLVLFLLAGCAGPKRQVASASVVEALSQGQGNFALATQPVPFEFPRDHGPHPAYRTEWWYFTGNLRDGQGRPYGFQLTFFRSALTADMPARQSDLATNQLYMAHFAVTSGPADRHLSFERFSRGAAGLAGAQGEPQFAVWLEDWRVQQTAADQYQLVARADHADGPVALKLTLRGTRPPVLHGNAGLSQKGPEPGNANYYYSLVGLETSGELTFAGQPVAVSGVSWMDHEYGTSSLSGKTTGWDWFAVQLDNGMALMFGEFHNGLGGERSVYAGTLAYPDGRQVKLEDADFDLTALGQWTSPVTGITYPAGWRVTMPVLGVELTIEPIVADQEMDVSFIYYEGATTVGA